MVDTVQDIHDARVLVCDPTGSPVAGERDAGDLLSAAWEANADWVALPVARLGPDFLRLSTRVAGEVIQKFVNYRLHLAIVGDLTPWTKASGALRDFVGESNRGTAVWFVDDLEALRQRLAGA